MFERARPNRDLTGIFLGWKWMFFRGNSRLLNSEERERSDYEQKNKKPALRIATSYIQKLYREIIVYWYEKHNKKYRSDARIYKRQRMAEGKKKNFHKLIARTESSRRTCVKSLTFVLAQTFNKRMHFLSDSFWIWVSLLFQYSTLSFICASLLEITTFVQRRMMNLLSNILEVFCYFYNNEWLPKINA